MSTTMPQPAQTAHDAAIASRDEMIDLVIASFEDLPDEERARLIASNLALLRDPRFAPTDLLARRAAISFWEAMADLARLDAGEPVEARHPYNGDTVAPEVLRDHLERRAWIAATIFNVRSAADLLPLRPLVGLH